MSAVSKERGQEMARQSPEEHQAEIQFIKSLTPQGGWFNAPSEEIAAASRKIHEWRLAHPPKSQGPYWQSEEGRNRPRPGDGVVVGNSGQQQPGTRGNKFPTSDPGNRGGRVFDETGPTAITPRPGFGNLHDGKGYIPDFRGAQPSGGQGLQGFGNQQAQDPRIQALLQMMQQGGNRPTVGMPDDRLSQAGRFETGR